MMTDNDAQMYWEALNWSGRTKLLRMLNLRSNMFNTDWEKLPVMVRNTIKRQWEAEDLARKREADRIDGYDRDDLGESPDY